MKATGVYFIGNGLALLGVVFLLRIYDATAFAGYADVMLIATAVQVVAGGRLEVRALAFRCPEARARLRRASVITSVVLAVICASGAVGWGLIADQGVANSLENGLWCFGLVLIYGVQNRALSRLTEHGALLPVAWLSTSQSVGVVGFQMLLSMLTESWRGLVTGNTLATLSVTLVAVALVRRSRFGEAPPKGDPSTTDASDEELTRSGILRFTLKSVGMGVSSGLLLQAWFVVARLAGTPNEAGTAFLVARVARSLVSPITAAVNREFMNLISRADMQMKQFSLVARRLPPLALAIFLVVGAAAFLPALGVVDAQYESVAWIAPILAVGAAVQVVGAPMSVVLVARDQFKMLVVSIAVRAVGLGIALVVSLNGELWAGLVVLLAFNAAAYMVVTLAVIHLLKSQVAQGA